MTTLEMAMQYYPRLWDIRRINQLLIAGKISVDEYTQITGQPAEGGKEAKE